MKSLKDLFVDRLETMHHDEKLIAEGLNFIAKGATCPRLREVIRTHLLETRGHIQEVENVFKLLGKSPGQRSSAPVPALLHEAEEIIREFASSAAINAALISVLQKIEHHEIASYGCLREWATIFGLSDIARMFHQILNNEKDTDDILTELARVSSNREADIHVPEKENEPVWQSAFGIPLPVFS